MARPTRTYALLPFRDLEPSRFEDLCLHLIYRLRRWEDIRHTGRAGSDGGIDIHATEILDDGRRLTWAVQCKRQDRFSASEARKALNELVDGMTAPPDCVILAVAGSPSKKTHDAFQLEARKRKIGHAQIWSASILEAKLFSERPDLVGIFFDIDLNSSLREREAAVRRSVAMKRRIYSELIDFSGVDGSRHAREPAAKFRWGKAIIHSAHGSTWPNVTGDDAETSGWSKVSFADTYHDGLLLEIGYSYILIDDAGCWSLISPEERNVLPNPARAILARQIGQLPYAGIVELDEHGDEYFNGPHLYCVFGFHGTPFDAYRFQIAGETTNTTHYLADALRKDRDALVKSVFGSKA